MAIFGSEAAHAGGTGFNPLLVILAVLLVIFIFIKFCGWAKGFQISGGIKKAVFVLTGIGLVVFNLLYSQGNALITNTGDWSTATLALASSMIWVWIFAFVLMAETKEA